MTPSKKVKEPFRFCTRLNLLELTGKKAKDVEELLAITREVSGAVIYHHTHHFLQQQQYISPEPPNDFAYWVTNILRESALGEKLASINMCEFTSVSAIRDRIVSILEKDLVGKPRPLRSAPEGEEFTFKRSITFILPTPYFAHDLKQFIEILKKISVNSIYFHVFEARLRSENGRGDFSNWIENSMGDKALADKLSGIDPYTYTLEGLREKIIRIIETDVAHAAVKEIKKGLGKINKE
ncbi:MAG: DUF5752 family protein [bacterium]